MRRWSIPDREVSNINALFDSLSGTKGRAKYALPFLTDSILFNSSECLKSSERVLSVFRLSA